MAEVCSAHWHGRAHAIPLIQIGILQNADRPGSDEARKEGVWVVGCEGAAVK